MKNKPAIGIVFGGRSVEHQVSIMSAENVFQNIDQNLYNPFLIGIDQDGDWYLTDQVNSSIGSGEKLNLSLSASNSEFLHQHRVN